MDIYNIYITSKIEAEGEETIIKNITHIDQTYPLVI